MKRSRCRTAARALALALGLVGALGCEREAAEPPQPAAPAAARPAAPAPAATPRDPVQEPLAGGPYPALLVTQAQFFDEVQPDGSKRPVPGPAKLLIVRETPAGWQTVTLEDPDSHVFHKAMPYDGGILTIAGTEARLKVWHFRDGAWQATTHWNPTFGGKFDRLRDVERGDVDGDGQDELVLATHDEGVIAVVHPDEDWRVDEVDRQPRTFVHEIEIGDVDGDGTPEFFATPSKPNKLDEEQPGEVTMYRREGDGWVKSIVDAPGDTHAKEILAADTDGDGVSELFVVWEGAVGEGGTLVRPVTVKEYRFRDGAFAGTEVGTVPDRQMRAIAAGDVNGDQAIDLVAAGLGSGLWLFERGAEGWTKRLIERDSAGFEHPVHLADLDGDGALEIYVAAENQNELRRHRWDGQQFTRTRLAPLGDGNITWNVAAGRF